eukprot:392444_1
MSHPYENWTDKDEIIKKLASDLSVSDNTNKRLVKKIQILKAAKCKNTDDKKQDELLSQYSEALHDLRRLKKQLENMTDDRDKWKKQMHHRERYFGIKSNDLRRLKKELKNMTDDRDKWFEQFEDMTEDRDKWFGKAYFTIKSSRSKELSVTKGQLVRRNSELTREKSKLKKTKQTLAETKTKLASVGNELKEEKNKIMQKNTHILWLETRL